MPHESETHKWSLILPPAPPQISSSDCLPQIAPTDCLLRLPHTDCLHRLVKSLHVCVLQVCALVILPGYDVLRERKPVCAAGNILVLTPFVSMNDTYHLSGLVDYDVGHNYMSTAEQTSFICIDSFIEIGGPTQTNPMCYLNQLTWGSSFDWGQSVLLYFPPSFLGSTDSTHVIQLE